MRPRVAPARSTPGTPLTLLAARALGSCADERSLKGGSSASFNTLILLCL